MTELYKKNGAVFIPSGITLEEVKELENKIAVLKNIIFDAMVGQEFCLLCKKKGQILPECKRMRNKDCLQHLVELYKKEVVKEI